MDIFNELGDALRPQRFEPISWPIFAPLYNSAAGWEFEKEQAKQRLAFIYKSERASALGFMAGAMVKACFDSGEAVKSDKYLVILDRIIQYQENLKTRYPLAAV